MKLSTVFLSITFAATAIALPAPIPAPENAIALLRRNAEAAITAAERYIRAREEEATSIGAALSDTSTPDIVNFFCSDAAAAALAAADAYADFARMLV